jgi:predicted RNA-binding Zn ribbon-like protein
MTKRVLRRKWADASYHAFRLARGLEENVLRWLNGVQLDRERGNTEKSRQRVRRLLEKLKAVSAVPPALILAYSKKRRLPKDLNRVAEEIDEQLRDYPTHKCLAWDRNGELDFGDPLVVKNRPEGEAAAALSAVELAQMHLVDRLRQCICGKWFGARSRNQKSCSSKCRHRRYEQTEEFKAKRRKYMRDYYDEFLSRKRFERKQKPAKRKGP